MENNIFLAAMLAFAVGFTLGAKLNRFTYYRRGYSAGFRQGWDRYRTIHRL